MGARSLAATLRRLPSVGHGRSSGGSAASKLTLTQTGLLIEDAEKSIFRIRFETARRYVVDKLAGFGVSVVALGIALVLEPPSRA